MTDYTRYAIYYAPEPGPFADFGASWLGWDAATGQDRAHPEFPYDVEQITRRPRKYGFHGTIKPPMRLTGSVEALRADLHALAARLSPVTLDGLTLNRLGRFLALTPVGDTSELSALAAQIVQGLDHHRAAPTPEEIERRRAKRLSPAQEKNLTDWGYPYVMDEFRFHLTLTGPIAKPDIDYVQDALRRHLTPILPNPLTINDLCLRLCEQA